MNKYQQQYLYAGLIIALVLALPACKKEDAPKPPATANIYYPAGGTSIPRYQIVRLIGMSSVTNGAFEWTVDGVVSSTTDTLYFVSDTEGPHEVVLSTKGGGDSATTKLTIQVNKENATYSKKVAKVFDYFPAPGQFVNALPVWATGETDAQVIAKAENALKTGGLIHLGGFGGYVVVGFDHAIINLSGKSSFKPLGNAFNQWSEAGIIEVALDANGNGLPDDEWYEIAGSEYNHPKTVKNYQITYHKPDENKVPTPSKTNPNLTDTTYIKWTDNQGGSGYLSKNKFHSQSYYPQWKSAATITFKGTKLTADNVGDQSGSGTFFVSPAFEFGYADNWPNNDARSEIKLDWAVNKAGKPVKLPGIHFVRIYTGIRAEAGWLGEVSTEIMGVEDLNLK
jgi:hypothetical protein